MHAVGMVPKRNQGSISEILRLQYRYQRDELKVVREERQPLYPQRRRGQDIQTKAAESIYQPWEPCTEGCWDVDAEDLDSVCDESNAETVVKRKKRTEEESSSSKEDDDISQMSEDEEPSSSDESTVAQAKRSDEDSDDEEYEEYIVGSDEDSTFSTKAGREELDSLKEQGKKIGEDTEKIKAMEIDRQAEKEAMNARMAELEERNRQMAEMFAQLSAAGGIPQGDQTSPTAEKNTSEDKVEEETDAGASAGNASDAPARGNGVRGHPSRRARCRKSGRRATNYRLSSASWAAKTTTSNKLKHEEVMSMIDRRSSGTRRSRITDDNIRDWVESEAFESRNAASMSILESKLNETSVTKDYPPHGSAEESRPDGVFRGMSVQLNGMVTSKFVGIGEVGVNWKKANRKRLLSLLPELTGEARAMTANNTTEKVVVHQQGGGVATLALGEIINYYKNGSKDFRHLGRWTSFTLQSIQGHRTRIVQAYGVRANRSNILGSVYQQHVRYIQQNLNENVSPGQLFESDLLWQLSVWRALGDRIILIMDINCHVLTGKLSRALTRWRV
eukprot:scaffold157988_cov45-Cyclotella_meneghiniana.AAC.2